MQLKLQTNGGDEETEVDSHCFQVNCKPKVCPIGKAGHKKHKQSHQERGCNQSLRLRLEARRQILILITLKRATTEEENDLEARMRNQLDPTYDPKRIGKNRMKRLTMESYTS